MKAYKCDSCLKCINDPYAVKMKEFNLILPAIPDGSGYKVKTRKKIHLCHDCFRGLRKIANALQASEAE